MGYERTDDLVTIAARLQEIIPRGLVSGMGLPEPGMMCVEAAVCYAMGLPHGDEPTCVNNSVRRAKIALNDAPWSSKAARAAGMLDASIAQLGSAGAEFDELAFTRTYALLTVQRVLPIALRAAGMEEQATACEAVSDLAEAEADATYLYVSSAAAAAWAAWAAWEAEAEADEPLLESARCLVESLRVAGSPGVKLLDAGK